MIEELQQSGGRQLCRAQVKAEVDQRIELALGERHLDQALDGLLGVAEVAGQDFGSLGLVDAIGKRCGVEQPVTIADSGKSGCIRVDATAKPLRLLEQLHSRGAESHVSLLPI